MGLFKKWKIVFAFLMFGLGLTHAQTWRCGDSLVDIRDGQKYPTIQIGNQCWMARNLNIGNPVTTTSQTNNDSIEKTCYNHLINNCDTFGGLYTWGEAVQYSPNEKQADICPTGWHIPTLGEWQILHHIVPDGQELKARKTDIPAYDGNNKSGFSAIPAGLAYYDVFGRKGDWAIFWTSSPSTEGYSWSAELDRHYLYLGSFPNLKFTNTYMTINAFSVRCVKD